MRAFALVALLAAIALLAAACGGPKDSQRALAEACDRQREEVAHEESDTPTAESTEQRLEEETLIECAGQDVTIVAADEASQEESPEGEEAGEGDESGEGEIEGEAEGAPSEEGGTTSEGGGQDEGTPEGEQPQGGGEDLTQVELDPASRDTFSTSCGGCHLLSDAGTEGAIGPNLDETELDTEGVAEKIEEGGGGMPPGLLQGDEQQAVAEYVAAAAAQAQAG